mgnify:CR=1 FL=1
MTESLLVQFTMSSSIGGVAIVKWLFRIQGVVVA